jgi:proline dehydrogenase
VVVDRAIALLLPAVPKPVVGLIAQRYIAGEELADAVAVVGQLNDSGRGATIDVLGEEVATAAEARALADAYREVLATIEREGLRAGVSVKLTALGLALDADLCRENVEAVVRDAAARGRFVRIDMEDSSTTDDTLRLYRELRGAGLDNVGIVLQAYLRRTLDDVAALAELRPSVRLCKGIYVEPSAIAYQDDDDVRRTFVAALEQLLDAGCDVAIATHDEWLIRESLRLLAGAEAPSYEFQMLLGVRAARGIELARAGHRVRVYVPFGRRWYEYSLRRLQENPRVAGNVAADTVWRLFGLRGSAR